MADDDPDHPMFGQNKLPDAVRRALERHSKILTSSEILGQWSGLEWITVSQTCHACGHVTKRVFSNADKIRCACCNHIQPMENTMKKPQNFREFYMETTGAPHWPGHPMEMRDVVILRVMDTIADYADYVSNIRNFIPQPTENTMQEHMNFGMALDALKRGTKVQREGWNGKGMVVVLSQKLPEGGPTKPYFTIKDPSTETISTWVPSVGDCLADDWQIVN